MSRRGPKVLGKGAVLIKFYVVVSDGKLKEGTTQEITQEIEVTTQETTQEIEATTQEITQEIEATTQEIKTTTQKITQEITDKIIRLIESEHKSSLLFVVNNFPMPAFSWTDAFQLTIRL
jgi:polyhydroxyalkanoate synthesis regulator phasin